MAVDLAGALGDVFWDLPPWITYTPGSDIGCVIFVANPTDVAREYALISHLSTEEALISEESVTVFGYSWFTVDPGGFVRLHGAFRFEHTNVTLTLSLIERESDEVTDTVSAFLAQPDVAVWPHWPGDPGIQEPGILPNGGFMGIFMMMLMMGMAFQMMRTPREEERRRPLPAGRGE